MLSARDLTVRRRGRAILDGVSLDLETAQVTALIGPNGAGKSTLLHALSGAIVPCAGTVRIAGRPLDTWRRADLARLRAVMPQSSELSFPFRAFEVVLMGRSAHAGRSSEAHDLAVALAALEAVDGGHLAERVYPTLSGGERQRVQLARVLAQIWPETTSETTSETASDGLALLPSERLLLLDEPTNNLDLTHQHQLMRTARLWADRHGVGVLAVLHDPNLAALYADRMVVLADGHLAAQGTVDEIMTAPVIGRVFDLAVTIERHPTRGAPQLMPV
ncbi:heme ABC transporter ATP-binding protein [Rhodothalassium salexigens]|uniref:heme ABC transporter ATP-binding protein n=1 Tax=Rhodothalassium salexigens TaxID=1086 RepID=UPI0019135EE2|nr:heme ABC transporter ATP-binding protein [Rhodothalassium salexigens]MBK5919572.1 heme ABC transporter ATP-binding protein [Rhodothalassium salexigens]